MQTITFYSYKGGSGRTLVVANVARYLARFGQKVVAVDFDLEAPGLHYKLALGQKDAPATIQRGLVDYLEAFESEGQLPPSIRDYVIPALSGVLGEIYVMPAGAAPSPEYWRKLSRIDWHRLFHGDNPEGVPLFLELQERIRQELVPDFLLIDARTGITEIGGVATTLLSDKVVCLLLNNRENLEGARTVLRSLQCAPRLSGRAPMELITVLARLPDLGAEAEQKVVADVEAFLNAPAERLEDTLHISGTFILHSEPALQVNEMLHVGGEKTTEESGLLRDYLRLFTHLIPPDTFHPYIGELLQRVHASLFDDPDGAERELEGLVQYLGYPDLFRELLKLYRIRNRKDLKVVLTAQRLWEIARRPEEPVLWDTVQRCLEGIYHTEKLSLHFIEDVWRAAGGNSVAVGMKLCELLRVKNQGAHATKLLWELYERDSKKEPDFLRRIAVQSGRLKHTEGIRELIERHAELIQKERELLAAVLDAVVEISDEELSRQLLEPQWIEQSKRSAPLALSKLLRRVGRSPEAESLADDALTSALIEGNARSLFEIGEMFDELGRSEQFEAAVRRRLGPEADRFLREYQHRPRRWDRW